MRWIIVDGIDGSGKNTHAQWLRELYSARGDSVRLFVHPSDRLYGRITRKALQGEGGVMRLLASIFFMLDVLISLSQMRRQGERFDTVIFVRYVMATAYLPNGLAEFGYKFFIKLLPLPRRLLLVDIDPKTALTRISRRDHRREMFETLSSLSRTREKILELAKDGWKSIDNSGDERRSHGRLIEIVREWEET